MRLKDKVALVTGAGSGIGRCAGLLFAKEGARVGVLDLSAATAEETAVEIRRQGGEAIGVAADVRRSSEVAQAVQRVVELFGQIDILYNHVGINRPGSVADLDEADWDAVLATNLKSVFLVSKYVLPHMMKQRRGVIVNTAGTFAFYGALGFAAYCASKGGVLNLTKQMALDYAPYGIRVNCVCPGFIDTPMNRGMPAERVAKIIATQPLGRAGQAEEVARAALFLASDEASFTTGAALLVDGGQLSGRHGA